MLGLAKRIASVSSFFPLRPSVLFCETDVSQDWCENQDNSRKTVNSKALRLNNEMLCYSNRSFSVIKLKGSAESAKIAVCFDLDTFQTSGKKSIFLDISKNLFVTNSRLLAIIERGSTD